MRGAGFYIIFALMWLSQKAALRSNIPLKNKDGPTTIALQCEGVFIFTVQKTMPPIRWKLIHNGFSGAEIIFTMTINTKKYIYTVYIVQTLDFSQARQYLLL